MRQIEVNCVSCDSVVIKTNLLKSNYIKMTRKFIFLNFNPPLIIIYVAISRDGARGGTGGGGRPPQIFFKKYLLYIHIYF